MFQLHTQYSIIALSGLDLCSVCSYMLYYKLSCDTHFPLKVSAPGVRLLFETCKIFFFCFIFLLCLSLLFLKQLHQLSQAILKSFKIVKFYAPKIRT